MQAHREKTQQEGRDLQTRTKLNHTLILNIQPPESIVLVTQKKGDLKLKIYMYVQTYIYHCVNIYIYLYNCVNYKELRIKTSLKSFFYDAFPEPLGKIILLFL